VKSSIPQETENGPEVWPPEPHPQLPPPLVQAANESNLVMLVGAGVSRLVGCPSWDELADRVLEQLAQRRVIGYGEIQQLAEYDARKKLSIAQIICQTVGNGASIDFESLLKPKEDSESRIYDYLLAIGCPIVTTNFDRLLDGSIPDPIKLEDGKYGTGESVARSELICYPSQFYKYLLTKPKCIIHLHGSIDHEDSMVFTARHYIEHYDDSRVVGLLQEMFSDYTVLIVGYGLEETELLDHIFRKLHKSGGRVRARYLLNGFYSHQQQTYRHLKSYYKSSFDVDLIPFPLEVNHYRQLEEIMKDWSGKLTIGTPLLSDQARRILRVARGEHA